MSSINRRDFIKLASGLALTGAGVGAPQLVLGAGPRVVVVGGGVGGCTVAKYLRKLDPDIQVTLISDKPVYTTCFLSNEVLGGERTLDSLTFDYDGLRRHGVDVVIDPAVGIDPERREVATAGGGRYPYDRCVISPGVDFKWERIDGYSPEVAKRIPHAWFAGPQTALLRNQLLAMPDGGTVVIVAPPNPFKCPPGPPERASQIAMYCKHHKPRSKVLLLDSKDAFSKQALYTRAWERLYGYGTENSLIEYVPAAAGGNIDALDPSTNTLRGLVEDFKGDVINIIPAQKAGHLAFVADLVDGDWCPVDKATFESTRHPGIHVLGDASDAAKMPKSAYAANTQAKVCAASIIAAFRDIEPPTPTYVNTCYSIAGEDYGFSVAAVYELDAANNMIEPVPDSGGLSPLDASPRQRKREVTFAHSWFRNIVDDMLG